MRLLLSLKEKNNHIEYQLAFLSIVLISLSKASNFTSVFVLLGIAPLFAIYDQYLHKKVHTLKFIGLIGLSLILSFCCWQILEGHFNFEVFTQALLHGALMAISLVLYWFTDKYARNRIGFFTVIIYWLALEYCSLLIDYTPSFMILGGVLSNWGTSIAWHTETGWLGISAWIITGNILFYYVFFKDLAIFNGRFRVLTLIYVVLFLSLPFIYGYFSANSTSLVEMNISASEEYLGRTAMWVTALLLSYGFVKSKVKK
ncbi:MAG: hypothetical protein AAFN93_01430 [Bacteroidota bacterium]